MIKEREHWMSLTRELNDRIMLMAERPWTLPPAQMQIPPEPELAGYLIDPGPENE